jgi:aldehyde:ferredoxin oxidoreductase
MQFLPGLAIALMDVRNYSRLFQAVTGIPMTQKAFLQAGARIHTLERLMNTREGIRRDQDTLPKRFLEEARQSDEKKRTVPLDQMIKAYYRLRGYDENGIPRAGTLKRLGLEGFI